MSARRCRALALLVATLAPRAAGEEATLASLTGLFQREPERAAALVASAREGARAINQSRHSEGHETYFRQRRRIEAAVGGYKFYVHAGGAFDAITTHFGRAAANLMDTVALKLKHGDRVPEELRPEKHSPLGATGTPRGELPAAARALRRLRLPEAHQGVLVLGDAPRRPRSSGTAARRRGPAAGGAGGVRAGAGAAALLRKGRRGRPREAPAVPRGPAPRSHASARLIMTTHKLILTTHASRNSCVYAHLAASNVVAAGSRLPA